MEDEKSAIQNAKTMRRGRDTIVLGSSGGTSRPVTWLTEVYGPSLLHQSCARTVLTVRAESLCRDLNVAGPMYANRSPWAGRFTGAMFILGGVAWAVLALLVLGNVLAGTGNYILGPASSRIVAGGGAGSWFTQGILAYGLVGIGGIGLTALLYQHVEGTLGSRLTGWRSGAAWVHLILGGIGAAAASLLMAWGGFQAGSALLPTNVGGGGQSGASGITFVHTNILEPIVIPIAALMGIALLGYLAGGIALASAWRAARKGSQQAE